MDEEMQKLLNLFRQNYELQMERVDKMIHLLEQMAATLDTTFDQANQEMERFAETRKLLEEMVGTIDLYTTRLSNATAAQIKITQLQQQMHQQQHG